MDTTSDRDKQYRTVLLISLAGFVGAPLCYLEVVHLINSSRPLPMHPIPVLMWLLLGLSIIQPALVSPYVTRAVLQAHRRSVQSGRGSPTTATTIMIMRMAAVESVFIYGLLYFFLAGETKPLYYFYAIGALAVVLNWPTRDRFDEYANTLEGK